MHSSKSQDILVGLKKRWMFWALLTNLALALAIAAPVYSIAQKFLAAGLGWGILLGLVCFAIISAVDRRWRLSEWDVSRFLNATKPALQESSQLVLQPKDSLSFLESLQLKKVETELQAISVDYPFSRQLKIVLVIFAVGITAAWAIAKAPGKVSKKETGKTVVTNINTVPEIVLPEIKKAALIITPPAYTGKAVREQERFNIQAEEGAAVSWRVQTTIAANNVSLIFNDGSTLGLLPDSEKRNWHIQKSIQSSGFYQVKIDDKLSELYRIEAIKDQKPVITVQSPKPSTTIAFGQPERVNLTVGINDDYGISQTYISATVSSGQGEAVKFREQKLSFAKFSAGRREYHLQKVVDCKALAMQPGDELYFFVGTIDNHQQETRSDVYIVTLEDTTGLFSMEGMATALDIKPELFRSQRQIIIETEQLLKDKAILSEEDFKKKSNDLGTDQKLLRLRYGKFLGEETDTEIGGGHDHEEGDHADETEDIMDQYSHKHDNAEDATFFDAATKKQLKETLNEMWKAELQLRTMKPKDALPFEYKALRLLKDLQQKSRVYVAKTGLKTTPLKLDKRLSGDLSAIKQPVAQRTIQSQTSSNAAREALGILEQLKYSGQLPATARAILQEAFQQLSSRAANQPAVFLTSLSALKKVVNDEYRLRDIEQAQSGLHKMISGVEKLPYSSSASLMELQKQYFMNLNKGRR